MKINKKLSIAALALFMSVASYAPVNAQDVSAEATVASARMAAGVWEHSNGEWSYVVNGVEQTGWIVAGGAWYYLNDNGVMQTGWALVDGTWYYLNDNGSMATGWTVVNGNWYYLNNSGEMQTGWTSVDGTWYYLDANGAMATGWLDLDGTWYYLNANGSMAKGWVLDNGDWFFLKADGSMVTGWLFEDRNWYYLDLAGRMLTDTTIGDWVIGSDGVATEVVKSSQTLLKEAIEEAKELEPTDYRNTGDYAGDRDKFTDALEAAQKVARDEKATDAQRDAAREKLTASIAKLVPINANKKPLIAEIRTAEALTEGDYIPEAWAAFQTVLAESKAVYADTDALVSEVVAATEALEKAIVEVNNNKKLNAFGSLEKTIDEADVIITAENGRRALDNPYGPYENYTDLTFGNLKVAYAAAEEAVREYEANGKPVANEDKLNEARTNLEAAIKGLKFEKIHTALQQELTADLTATRQEHNVSTDYTKSSWDNYKKVLEEAQAVANKPESNLAIENAMVDLDVAINGIVGNDKVEGLVSVKALNAEIKQAKAYKNLEAKSFDVTEEYWAQFVDALAKAEIVADDVKAKRLDVNNNATALKKFNDTLLSKKNEKNELEKANKALEDAIANATHTEDTTLTNWSAYKTALGAALEAKDGKDADGNALSAADIAKFAEDLVTAQNALEAEIEGKAKETELQNLATALSTNTETKYDSVKTIYPELHANYVAAFKVADAIDAIDATDTELTSVQIATIITKLQTAADALEDAINADALEDALAIFNPALAAAKLYTTEELAKVDISTDTTLITDFNTAYAEALLVNEKVDANAIAINDAGKKLNNAIVKLQDNILGQGKTAPTTLVEIP